MNFALDSAVAIYDSNVWVHGLTHRSADAEACVQAVFDEVRCVLVTPYIYEEVDQALKRDAENQHQANNLRDAFANIMSNPLVNAPSHQEVSEIDLETIRSDPTVQSYAEALDIQAKDVPILRAAQQCCNSERKERYNLGRIQFEYVKYPGP